MPFDAIKGFVDPSVQFALQFETLAEAGRTTPPATAEADSRRAASRRASRGTPAAPEAEPRTSVPAQLRVRRAPPPDRSPATAAGTSRSRQGAAPRSCGSTASARSDGQTAVPTQQAAPSSRPAPRPTPSARSRCRPTATGARRPSARCENFRIGTERMPRPLIRALGIVKRAAAEVNHALGSLDARAHARDRQRRAGGDRRQARRSFPAGGLADRLRHPDQHERQRGDRQPRQRDARRQARREVAGASQRSRQHEPVVERLLPDRDAHRRGRGDRAAARSGAGASAGRAADEEPRSSPASSRSAAPTRRTRRR